MYINAIFIHILNANKTNFIIFVSVFHFRQKSKETQLNVQLWLMYTLRMYFEGISRVWMFFHMVHKYNQNV